MLSLKDIAAVKVAVQICNNPQLKKEILCLSGSDYDINKRSDIKHRKIQWDDLLEKKAEIILERLGLIKQWKEKLIGIILSIGMRMLSWAEYHERILGFSRNYSFNFLNSSLFEPRGIINCKKAAEELMIDEILSIKQKYKLALLYCMNNHIPDFYKQMTEKDKEEFYDSENPSRIKQPHFVKFWSYYLKGEVDKLSGDMDPNLYCLQMAVKSGSKDVVEYCLEETNLIGNEDALIFAALEAVKFKLNGMRDWIVFGNDWRNSDWRDGDCKDDDWSSEIQGDGESEDNYLEIFDYTGPWVPNHYYMDVTCFLLSKMRQDTQVEFLKKDINNLPRVNFPPDRPRVWVFFLDWPYQDYFLKTAKLMWEFLQESHYYDLFERFIFKIGARKGDYKYGEEKYYDYRELLRVFLNEIPEPYKICVCRDYETDNFSNDIEIRNASIVLISYLFQQKNFTNQDKIIIECILNNATNEEKEKMISSEEGLIVCVDLIILKRWELLEEFVSSCYTSKRKIIKFKKKLSFREDSQDACIDFITNADWSAFNSFIKWSTFSHVEINQLKELMINSDYGRCACLKIISSDKKLTVVNDLINWCLPTKKKVIIFKKKLLSSKEGMQKCVELLISDQAELANEFVKYGISFEQEYKKNVACKIGRNVCERLIFNISIIGVALPVLPISFPEYPNIHSIHDRGDTSRFQFNDSKWKEVDQFLNWCFLSQDEINNFKNSLKMKDADDTWKGLIHMHLYLTRAKKWKDTERLFSWLSLSVKEIRELKKETILSTKCMKWINTSVQDSSNGNIVDYENGKWDEMQLFLRWFLEDKDDVLQFKNRFDEKFGFKSYKDRGEYVPKNININLIKFYYFIQHYVLSQ